MAVATQRDYDLVTLPGAASTTAILRVPVGLDAADYQDLPLEEFITVEATGIGDVNHA